MKTSGLFWKFILGISGRETPLVKTKCCFEGGELNAVEILAKEIKWVRDEVNWNRKHCPAALLPKLQTDVMDWADEQKELPLKLVSSSDPQLPKGLNWPHSMKGSPQNTKCFMEQPGFASGKSTGQLCWFCDLVISLCINLITQSYFWYTLALTFRFHSLW